MAGHRDHERFTALTAQHVGIVRKVATTYCRDAEDRADLAQEILTQLWIAWPRYDDRRRFSTWMYRIAFNVAITHVRGVYRGERRFVPLDDTHLQVAAEPVDRDAAEALAALEAMIAELDPLNGAVLLLYLDDRSHAEIAEILGIGRSNVGTKINRLKRRLRDRFA